MNLTRVLAASVLIPVTATLLSCSRDGGPTGTPTTSARPTPVPAAEYRFPRDLAGDFTFQWSADEGIDLGDTPSAIVRAFEEGYVIARKIGARFSYPGYLEAVPDRPTLRTPDGGDLPSGAEEGNWLQRLAGTVRARILQITPADEGFTAAYCTDYFDAAFSQDGGKTYWWTSNGSNGEPISGAMIVLEVRPVPGRTPPEDTSEQIGPDRAPRYNVFDGWEIVEEDGWVNVEGTPPPGFSHLATLNAECNAWARSNPHTNPAPNSVDPDRVNTRGIERQRADPVPAAEPQSPGWPVPVQY
ncbi:hypothetical protein IU474_16635 [Nocardia otitidiscaviarum]|uniref:hypothetical protein n=1 Tax=Nocardia otitidiscaviarum TaxID=1823 RepID=UPI0018942FDD|nr:hypothetical protein [Nocardia otitidiscaviarum]MBF6238677.1 hypothetical protein [Nocardia otitidiscaviarum]